MERKIIRSSCVKCKQAGPYELLNIKLVKY